LKIQTFHAKNDFKFKDLNLNTKIKSLNGREFSALKIFSESLKWLHQTVINELNDQSLEKIKNENIKWILTVPAIWKQKAKSFMREACYQAINFFDSIFVLIFL
jgi:hypothetical protein